ncbi:histidine phosphatase family protein [Shimia thalassica]|uniref:histidine phosphatase family protein n=1 Tax=Shimia thalassica TaxID=1715693 RepID=UPI00249513F6|nr:histidine phosphatase family protein [Shimia thalassica]MDO6485541.1 histidine phosphatase family protein [Shimia thalassica]MDP2496241.1 histidine phosphatase family protein [Shimia thalassica]MDP2582349.1 histidine phosphatase family protein [Shimia thalassica]
MSQMFHLVRHAQASFGAADYDNLSPLGHRQSEALGTALRRQGVQPDKVFIGAMKRHRQTWEGMAKGMNLDADPVVLPGLNEFDFKGLLDARFAKGGAPEGMHDDRRQHFRTLRDTVLMWQNEEIENPPERFADFSARVREAREVIAASGAKVPLAVSSGGAIGQTVAEITGGPADQMIALQLQVKNCAVARFVVSRNGTWLHGFNETPHIQADNEAEMLTYS